MAVELKVPSFGESITEALIARWLKAEGEYAGPDEPVVVLETDKVTSDVPAPAAGMVVKHLVPQGQYVKVGDPIALIDDTAAAPAPARSAPPPAEAPAAPPAPEARVMPAARRALEERGLTPGEVPATGPGGRLLKEDVLRYRPPALQATPEGFRAPFPAHAREEEAVPMTPLRRRVAERLVAAQQTAALLTTFNEVDMSEVIALRERHREAFEKQHGVKLGFMSFFVKAAVEALKLVPQVNAEIRGETIVFRNYYDIGIAVGGGRGLVVPVLRDADRKSFAAVEREIGAYAEKARNNTLTLDDLAGGTFTISNGGIYGSMLSTPIVNAPQSGILGLHAIQERPAAREGQVVIRPLMFVALTYDHRIIDGREAVTFLKRIKECVEQPARLLLEI